ncbi:hypothetical protein D3C73_1382890 [compost metagenome]
MTIPSSKIERILLIRSFGALGSIGTNTQEANMTPNAVKSTFSGSDINTTQSFPILLAVILFILV